MHYAQSTAKGHIKAKQNVFLPQVQKKNCVFDAKQKPLHISFMSMCLLCAKLGLSVAES